MAWLLPELEVGEEPELKPLEFELLELLELDSSWRTTSLSWKTSLSWLSWSRKSRN